MWKFPCILKMINGKKWIKQEKLQQWKTSHEHLLSVKPSEKFPKWESILQVKCEKLKLCLCFNVQFIEFKINL